MECLNQVVSGHFIAALLYCGLIIGTVYLIITKENGLDD